MTTNGAPQGRTLAVAVWTGTAFIVWGGTEQGSLGTGASYDPATDTWTPLPASGAPSPRSDCSAVWANDEMIVWGGTNTFDWLDDGAIYTPAQSAWTSPTNPTGAPAVREAQSAVWTSQAMVVWGGFNGGVYLDTGGSLDPTAGPSGTWTALSAGAPSARQDHTALWTGTAMMVWGGCSGCECETVLGDGALWTPGTGGGGSWDLLPASAELTARHLHTAVWTGSEVIVWGGQTAAGLTDTGAEGPP
jgi:hypothetical protein